MGAMPPIQLFARACAGYEVVTKPAIALSAFAYVRSKCQINPSANDFVGLWNLMQMCRLAARVHYKQAAVFQPEVHWSAADGFDLEFAT